MKYPGFAIVHVQSPCTEYNNTYEQLKGNVKKGIQPMAWSLPEDHNPESVSDAQNIVARDGIPLGLIYQAEGRTSFSKRVEETTASMNTKSA